MNSELSRRSFIKTGLVGAGTILTWTVLTNEAQAGTGVKFYTKKGKKGCKQCERAIAAMLKDKKKRAELSKLFPNNAKVYFYVRKQKSSTKVPENSIVVGGCAKALAPKAKVEVKGCHKQIKPDYVYKTIVDKLAKKD